MGRGFVTRLLLLLITCYHHLKHSGVAEGVTVLRFQEDRVARGDTQAVYQGDLDPARRLLSLTLCARFFLFTLHSRSTFFSLSSDTAARDVLDGELWVEKVRPVLARNWNFQLLKEPLWVFRWHHLCFTYDHRQHVISTYVDGRLNNEQQYEVGASFSGSRVVLGQGNGPKRSLSADLSQVGTLELVKGESSTYSEMWVRVPLKRLASYAVLNIYLPTLVLLVVDYFTLFFRPSIFDVRMMAALTVQLVIATLFSQVSASLPKTSYFKMVDVWLIFCIGITFLTIIFHVLVDACLYSVPKDAVIMVGFKTFRDNKKGKAGSAAGSLCSSKPGDRMVLWSKIIVAGVFVIFNLIYWIYILA